MNFNQLSKSQKIIFGIVIFFILLFISVLTGILPGLKITNNGAGGLSGEVQFWGIDSEDAFSEDIDSFNSIYPNISVVYKEFNPNSYEVDLLDALASGNGPDLLMIGHNWTPKHFEKLAPIPSKWLSIKNFKELFVDVASNDLIYNNQIWGLPLFVDTLGLYYNKDIFNTVGLALPPDNWDNFQKYTIQLTEKSLAGQIIRAGASMGTTNNIVEAQDILITLMMQSGAEIVSSNGTADFNSEAGRNALSFYTGFANPTNTSYSWNSNMPDSLEAFSRGQSAMMIDYLSANNKIQELNPYLNYGITSLPQLNSNLAKNTADYWALSVSKMSKNPEASWQLAFYLTDSLQAENYNRNFNRPPARRDLISKMIGEEVIGVFANQSLSAKSWLNYNPSRTKVILKEMIDAVSNGRFSISQALSQAVNEINSLKKQQ